MNIMIFIYYKCIKIDRYIYLYTYIEYEYHYMKYTLTCIIEDTL